MNTNGQHRTGLAPGTTMGTLRRTIEVALKGAVHVSAGAGPLSGHRVPAMMPLRLVADGADSLADAGHPTFTGVQHREDLAA